MLRITALALLVAASFFSATAETFPTSKIDLLADPSFKNWVFHLSEKNSLSTKREEVAVIKDGVLQVTGKGFGYFRTRDSYKNYHLVAEFKWGEKTWSKREERARDCGLLLHCHGPDGSFGGAWISCVQAQMLEGATGDINVLRGKTKDGKLISTTVESEVRKDDKGRIYWKKGGTAIALPPKGKAVQSIGWRDKDPDWKDTKGFRGAKDVEKPAGKWNTLEVICDGATFKVILNGTLVNEVRDVTPAAGYIGIQNEWAECWFRRLELWPLGAAPAAGKPAKK